MVVSSTLKPVNRIRGGSGSRLFKGCEYTAHCVGLACVFALHRTEPMPKQVDVTNALNKKNLNNTP